MIAYTLTDKNGENWWGMHPSHVQALKELYSIKKHFPNSVLCKIKRVDVSDYMVDEKHLMI